MIPGIDVSKWQDDNSTPQKMDFTKAKAAGAEFVFIKATERMGIDADFLWNWKNARAAGLLRGAYHFLRWDVSGLMQARFFCSALGDDIGELPLVADFEAPPKYSSSTQISHYPSNALLFQFLEEVETITGEKPMIYTSPGFWNTNGKKKNSSFFDQKWAYYPLWVAHYGVKKPIVPIPWKDWTFWQYSAAGDGPKYGAESKGLDMNWFNGGLMQLYDLAGLGEVQPPEDPPDPPLDVDISMRLSKLESSLGLITSWAKGIGYK